MTVKLLTLKKINNPSLKWFSLLIVYLFLLSNPAFGIDLISNDSHTLSLSGYLKNLFAVTRPTSFFGLSPGTANKNSIQDYNRFRLKLKYASSRFDFVTDYELQCTLRNSSNTLSTIGASSAGNLDRFLKLEHQIASRNNITASQGLDRLYFKFYLPKCDLTIGRQAISWGSAYFWRPTDLFFAFTAGEIDKDEKYGIDAVNLYLPFGPIASFNLIFAPHNTFAKTSIGTRFLTHFCSTDLAFIYCKMQEKRIYGFDFSGAIKKMGVYGEYTFTDNTQGTNFSQTVIGTNYIFQNTFGILAEYYCNGLGQTNKANYTQSLTNLVNGDTYQLGKHYMGIAFNYDLNPLNIIYFRNIFNLNDKSSLHNMYLEHSFSDNTTCVLGISICRGSTLSEYGEYPNVVFGQLKWYF